MKIIIAGDGKVGATLTRQLTSEGYDVTIIDSKASPLESSVERYDVISVQGNCASMDVLRQAGVKDADLLIAAVCTGIGHNTRFGCRGLGGYSALIIVVGNSYSKAVRHTFIGNVDRCCIRVFFYQGKGCCGEIYCLCSSITESKG